VLNKPAKVLAVYSNRQWTSGFLRIEQVEGQITALRSSAIS
jgi:hypothetical protein